MDIEEKSIKKACSYIAQYPVLRTGQCALHFTSLTDLFTQTPSVVTQRVVPLVVSDSTCSASCC